MMYDISYLQTNDIDWFFRYNGVAFHAASAGGMLPDTINDRETLRSIQYRAHNLPDVFGDEDIVINREAIDRVLRRNEAYQIEDYDYTEMFDFYLESFISMARKGFVSIDRTNIDNPYDDLYHVVCYPRDYRDIKLDLDLPLLDRVNELFFCTKDENVKDGGFVERIDHIHVFLQE